MDRLETAPPGWPLKTAPDFFGVPRKPMTPREIEHSILQNSFRGGAKNSPVRAGAVQLGPYTNPTTGIHSGLCTISGRVAINGLERGPLGDPVQSPCNVNPKRQ